MEEVEQSLALELMELPSKIYIVFLLLKMEPIMMELTHVLD